MRVLGPEDVELFQSGHVGHRWVSFPPLSFSVGRSARRVTQVVLRSRNVGRHVVRPEVTHRGFSASPLRIQAQWAASRPLPFVGQGGASRLCSGLVKRKEDHPALADSRGRRCEFCAAAVLV